MRLLVPWPRQYIGSWAGTWIESVGRRDCSRVAANTEPAFYCIHIVQAGKVRLQTENGVDTTIEPGGLFSLWPGVGYQFGGTPAGQGHLTQLYWVRLQGSLVSDFMRALGPTVTTPTGMAAYPKLAIEEIQKMIQLAQQDPPGADMESISLLHRLANACGYRQEQASGTDSLAQTVRNAMEQHVELGMGIAELSNAYGISRSNLFLQFKREFDRSPMDVLTEIRMAHAKRLLANTRLSIAQVSLSSGFSDPLYFSRQFRRCEGCPPSLWRQQFGQGRTALPRFSPCI